MLWNSCRYCNYFTVQNFFFFFFKIRFNTYQMGYSQIIKALASSTKDRHWYKTDTLLESCQRTKAADLLDPTIKYNRASSLACRLITTGSPLRPDNNLSQHEFLPFHSIKINDIINEIQTTWWNNCTCNSKNIWLKLKVFQFVENVQNKSQNKLFKYVARCCCIRVWLKMAIILSLSVNWKLDHISNVRWNSSR